LFLNIQGSNFFFIPWLVWFVA